METTEIIGLTAATLTTSAFVPQVYKALKDKSTADISLTMYIVLLAGLILWIIYGIHLNSLAIILANVVTGILAITMLILKLIHK
ncbi:Sugar transporter SemiSWEET [Flagellimonas maritima]|uniref:Sugar transporter SemiSWEET n=1 Tax=Flagellimonas maritima TaxID=1383885 RepID=A0A2Z4LS03_9FLAO|nr:SemiSWEET transporter [Allomuricauda aurantiaca]AWX44118.1 Sugar transporter SemiSWEET [Allomuricauda aurantiaca]